MADLAELSDELERSHRRYGELAGAGDALAFILRSLAWNGNVPTEHGETVRVALRAWMDLRP